MDRVSEIWKGYKAPIVLGVLSIFAISISITILVKSSQTTTPIIFSQANSEPSGNLFVDVEGAVLRPGLIALWQGARVEDAIASAGGLTTVADDQYIAKNINRAMKVTDGMKLYIPGIDETSHIINVAQSKNVLSQSTSNISVNTASKNELESLPGVGPVIAQKIIDNRPYQALEDLVTKKAIGASLFEKLKNQLSL